MATSAPAADSAPGAPEAQTVGSADAAEAAPVAAGDAAPAAASPAAPATDTTEEPIKGALNKDKTDKGAAKKGKDAKAKGEAKENKSSIVAREDNLTYDLHHMAAYDIAPLPPKSDFLSYTRDSVQLLVNKMFSLPHATVEEGQKAKLPERPLFVLPRSKPIPKEKPQTRWDKFMEDRGMVKRKRSRLVWDENSGDWKPRWGYKSAKDSDDPEKHGIYEFKPGEDTYADPFERIRAEKKLARVKHKLREVRNKVEGMGGSIRAATPDLRGSHNPKQINTGRGVDGLQEVLKRAQESSGSRFKFDRVAPNEATNLRTKKAKIGDPVTGEKERDRYMKFAGKVLSGEGQYDKDKMAKAGAAPLVKKNKKGVKGTKGDPGKGRRSKQGGRNAGAKKKGRKIKP